ncbi:DJ-1/PfpI family protein [Campylobacter sp. 9BO]|uniref:DJ-1/PfpI family protein n=1 Tax=Campylobacter sp. 9BO TaxID=3424759 RepID=UPI003D334BED
MKIALVMYDKMNLANFATLMAFFKGFDGVRLKTCAFKNEVVCELGVRLHPDIFGESIYGADMIVIPDGLGALSLRYDEIFLSWIKSGSSAKLKFGFDLGSLIFAGAGFLEGKSAAIRGGYKNALSEYCTISEHKICFDEGVISASEFSDELKAKLGEILAMHQQTTH